MRIVCPHCAATYEVPDSLLTAGRPVRCARCAGEWAPVVEAPVEPLPAEPELPPEPPPPPPPPRGLSGMDRLVAQAPPPKSKRPLRLAWAASLLLLLALAWSAYQWRGEIVRTWPPSGRVYAAFGWQAEAPAR